jgi:hypothetical protein
VAAAMSIDATRAYGSQCRIRGDGSVVAARAAAGSSGSATAWGS